MAKHIDLEAYANGALSERVNQAMQEVARNIMDPNTKADKKRTITVTLTFTPAKNRQTAAVDISTKTALAPPDSIQTAMLMGKDLRTGRVEAQELATNQEPEVPGQFEMMDGNMIDTATGEIEPLPGNIRRLG